MTHLFETWKPLEADADTITTLSNYLRDAYDYIIVAVPHSAERTLAVRKLQEAQFWADRAIIGNTLH